jgi:hypothetical protein
MRILVRRAVARPLPRWDLWLALATAGGFLALLVADAVHPLLVLALEVFLLF